ncbi:MAG: glycosyltransferase [Blautia sp.]|nr:glycosyltransferase [Blautia sp.]MCM1200853.1 glycosyltransferase [Bacteroides fragilis]
MKPMFSILVVCLNPGGKLKMTLESIRKQTCRDYEVIVKDGLSSDGSPALAQETADAFPSFRMIGKKDGGIYDAMNQAVQEAGGRYLYFLNCGDRFYHEKVLEEMAGLIAGHPAKAGIYYGNIYERVTGREVASNPKMDAFGCYRNVPCHQACFYDRKLLLAHPFETKYRVRADYEQFLWCFFTKEPELEASFIYGGILIADYEGGGFSEAKRNRRLSAAEHKEIVGKYMSAGKVWKYRMIMWATLAPVRTWIAGNPATSGLYNGVKKKIYGKG